MRKFKTLKLTTQIRLVINDTAQSLTIKQALEQFMDGGLVEQAIKSLDANREAHKDLTGILGQFGGKTIQIDIY